MMTSGENTAYNSGDDDNDSHWDTDFDPWAGALARRRHGGGDVALRLGIEGST
jgi:hypothetical protein